AVKFRRIVAGRDDNPPSESPASNFKGNIRRWIRPVHQNGVESVAAEDFAGGPRELFREKPDVIADEHPALAALDGLEIIRAGLGRVTNVLKREGIGDDAAPAVGAELNGYRHVALVFPPREHGSTGRARSQTAPTVRTGVQRRHNSKL